MDECIFCKIIKGEIPCAKIFEDNNIIAFDDINPKALVHVLFVPKKHIESIMHIEESDKELIGELFLIAKKIAKEKNLTGYKLLFNVGKDAGQVVPHLHLHLLSPEWEKSI